METLWLTLGLTLTAALLAALVLALRGRPSSAAAGALDRGDFEEAALDPSEDRDSLVAAAVAAKHLLDFSRAGELLDRALALDPRDGEAWLERGLVHAYVGERQAASEAFSEVELSRADLLESLTLHRAWLAFEGGDEARARRLFEEIEAPLENKLVADLGGDPLFAEWFWHASLLWRLSGRIERADWAWNQGLAAAPASRLPERLEPRASTPSERAIE